MHTLIGHEGEISKVAFNPQGTRVITASSDKTCRLWDTDTGDCLQVCAFKPLCGGCHDLPHNLHGLRGGAQWSAAGHEHVI